MNEKLLLLAYMPREILLSNRLKQFANQAGQTSWQNQELTDSFNEQPLSVKLSSKGLFLAQKWEVSWQTSQKLLLRSIQLLEQTDDQSLHLLNFGLFAALRNILSAYKPPFHKGLRWRELENFLRDHNDRPALQFPTEAKIESALENEWLEWLLDADLRLWQAQADRLLRPQLMQAKSQMAQEYDLMSRIHCWQGLLETLNQHHLFANWQLEEWQLKAIDGNWIVVGHVLQTKYLPFFKDPADWGHRLAKVLLELVCQYLPEEADSIIVAEVEGN